MQCVPEDRFKDVLMEMRRDREEQNRQCTEDRSESDRKWWGQNRKWRENQKAIDAKIADIRKQGVRYENNIDALAARLGDFSAEEAFRNGLRAILEESFGVKVLNVTEYDHAGEVFGRPDQVELDVIIYNGLLILCEIKSSISKPDLHFFDRKAAYYAKHHQREVNRKMVISPMVDPRAMNLAKELGIEVYSHSYDVVG